MLLMIMSEVCPYSGSVSGDVVYGVLPPLEDLVLDISSCFSSYDTKLYEIMKMKIGNFASTIHGESACND